MARLVVPDELASPLDDAWLARCVRAVCPASRADARPIAEVAADLGTTLRGIVTP